MKSYKDLLNEIQTNRDDKFIQKVLKNIQPWIKAIGGVKNLDKEILYRGIGNAPNVTMKDNIKVVRTDRKPRDTNIALSGLLDDWFNKKFRHKYRTQALFATGVRNEAKRFGSPMVILPIGKFEYVWGKQVDDLTNKLDGERFDLEEWTDGWVFDHNGGVIDIVQIIEASEEDITDNFLSTTKMLEWEGMSTKERKDRIITIQKNVVTALESKLNKYKYTDSNITTALGTGFEISIKVKSYYILSDANDFGFIGGSTGAIKRLRMGK